MSDQVLTCESCGMEFRWTHEEQLQAVKEVPLDDLLDAPGQETPHFIQPPKECKSCRPKQDQQRS